MTPSKEAVETIRKALYEVDFSKKYDTQKLLEIAYEIDVAPLERRIEELEKMLEGMAPVKFTDCGGKEVIDIKTPPDNPA